MSDEEDLRTTQDSLTILLSDDSAFESALNAIYEVRAGGGRGRVVGTMETPGSRVLPWHASARSRPLTEQCLQWHWH